jgi:hypothetical protein
VLQYLLGLRRLGHRVIFVEPLPADKLAGSTAYFRQVMSDFGLGDSSALLAAGTRESVGMPRADLLDAARGADLLLNVSGMLTDPDILGAVPVRVYLDLDPAFVQLWHAQGIDMRFDGHTHFVTVGQAIGTADCPVPTCGRRWLPTFQPVVLERWPVAERTIHDALTTIGNWRGYGSVEHGGVLYGQKAHSLRRFMTLPTLTRERFALALAIHPGEVKDLAALRENRWDLLDPGKVADSPASYRDFVAGSKAEFGIAKSGYVLSKCGWFSDRSACYLASSRPVLAQDTGFRKFLPTGEGLFAFNSTEEVLATIDAMNRDYPRHRRAARALAEEYFDSDRVLPRLLEQVGGAP